MSARRTPRSGWRRLLYESSLLLVIGVFAVITMVGQSLTGWSVYNEELAELHELPLSFGSYLCSGHWLEATFENWESEFLQMALFVLLTVWLRQKGSSESKKIDEEEEVDRDPDPRRADAPWPVRRGGFILVVYKSSLALAFFLLFALSFWLHADGGARVESIENLARGAPPVSTLEYIATSKFWFESLQNWQSEFISILAIVGFSIFLRQQGSPQSKPVDEPHASTGES